LPGRPSTASAVPERNESASASRGTTAFKAASERSWASACMRTVRETDLVARLGGDEFAVLLPGSNLTGATGLAARLRDAIEQAEIQEGGALRVSVGIAAAEHGRGQAEHIVQLADRDLYQDKAVRKTRASGDSCAA